MHKEKQIYLIRHGETEWTINGRHTGRTDIPLTEKGKNDVHLLAKRLKSVHFSHVFTGPLQRVYETCSICNLAKQATITDNLNEWDYGKYEGLKTEEIYQENPNWNLFIDGAPLGESLSDIEKRASLFLRKLEKLNGNIAVFSSGHFSRAIGVKWLGLPIEMGRLFILSPASLSILSYEHNNPAMLLWNDIGHLSSYEK